MKIYMLKPNKFDTMSWTYNLVKKNDEVFTPLRATGLALELAHKLAKEKGTGNVCLEDLRHVRVTGETLMVNASGWRKSRGINLQLEKRDCAFALLFDTI